MKKNEKRQQHHPMSKLVEEALSLSEELFDENSRLKKTTILKRLKKVRSSLLRRIDLNRIVTSFSNDRIQKDELVEALMLFIVDNESDSSGSVPLRREKSISSSSADWTDEDDQDKEIMFKVGSRVVISFGKRKGVRGELIRYDRIKDKWLVRLLSGREVGKKISYPVHKFEVSSCTPSRPKIPPPSRSKIPPPRPKTRDVSRTNHFKCVCEKGVAFRSRYNDNSSRVKSPKGPAFGDIVKILQRRGDWISVEHEDTGHTFWLPIRLERFGVIFRELSSKEFDEWTRKEKGKQRMDERKRREEEKERKRREEEKERKRREEEKERKRREEEKERKRREEDRERKRREEDRERKRREEEKNHRKEEKERKRKEKVKEEMETKRSSDNQRWRCMYARCNSQSKRIHTQIKQQQLNRYKNGVAYRTKCNDMSSRVKFPKGPRQGDVLNELERVGNWIRVRKNGRDLWLPIRIPNVGTMLKKITVPSQSPTSSSSSSSTPIQIITKTTEWRCVYENGVAYRTNWGDLSSRVSKPKGTTQTIARFHSSKIDLYNNNKNNHLQDL